MEDLRRSSSNRILSWEELFRRESDLIIMLLLTTHDRTEAEAASLTHLPYGVTSAKPSSTFESCPETLQFQVRRR